ncbi:MAG TPA: NUDIX domain-containing protein [Polyangiales bacterium]|nr:NUDIX domain-containing protein [Polyangiales bacterium]
MHGDEIQQLSGLLRKLAAAGMGVPRMPRTVFESLRGVAVQPAVELLVTTTGRDVLLTRRDDEHWSGFHIPGGFVGCGETLEMACARVATAELGVGARMERLIGHYTWPDHPYASALSLLCLCRVDETPRYGRFFDPLPSDILAGHRQLLEAFWLTA